MIATDSAIGAIELKRQYQSSMVSALILAALFHLCLVSAALIWDEASGVPGPPPGTSGETEGQIILRPLPPPPPIDAETLKKLAGSPPVEFSAGSIPVPTPDEFVIEEPAFPTKAELASYNAGQSLPGLGPFGEPGGTGDASGLAVVDYPKPEDFVVVDTMPVLVKLVEPEYPEVAVLTKVQGAVWIQALVDIDGSVKKARVLKHSDTKVGFEEAAVSAAYECKYRPALQNNRPVAVWVAYKVQFKLAEHQ
ncbi:MAG: TonB family protein [candidate division Zixibacteria bacterium]|nr:TonB family protein [candidate division Zixibacteria bacterium]